MLFSIRLLIAHFAFKNLKYQRYFDYDLPIANGIKLKFVDSNMVLCIMLFLWFEFYLDFIICIKPDKWFWTLISDFIYLNPYNFFRTNSFLKFSNYKQCLNFTFAKNWINDAAIYKNVYFHSKKLHFCKLQINNRNRFALVLINTLIEKTNVGILTVMSKLIF